MTMSRRLTGSHFRRLLGAGLIVFVLAICGASMVVRLGTISSDRLQGSSTQGPIEDYVAFYTSGRMVLEGDGSRLYDEQAITDREHALMGRPVGGSGSLAFFNPPFVALGFAPLSLLPISTFPVVLTAALAAMSVIAAFVLGRFIGLRGLTLLLVVSAFLTLHSVYWLLLEGQLSLFVFFAWLGFAYFHLVGKKTSAGLCLALGLVKPQMLLLLLAFLVFNREWKTLRAFSTAAGVLVAASVIVATPEVLLDYPAFLLASTGFSGHGVATESMYGINGLIARTLGDPTPSTLWLLFFAPPLLWLTIHAWQKAPPTSSAFPMTLAVTLSAALLLNPHLYFQDMVLVPLAMAFAARSVGTDSRSASTLMVLAGAVWVTQLLNFRLADANLNVLTPLVIAFLLVCHFHLRQLSRTGSKQVGVPSDDVRWTQKVAA